MRKKPNAQYNLATPDSLAIRVAGTMRRRMYARLLQRGSLTPDDTILDVGVTSDRSYESSNYLEAWYPKKDQVTAVGIDDASFLEQEFPGMRFVRANGNLLPFRSNSFDVVHSSAVIEHVGHRATQERFLAELYRVTRRVVCLTTPNRWFPIEVHTGLPLVHWLPPALFRSLLSELGLGFYAEESNLNLLDRRGLLEIASQLQPQRVAVEKMRLFGWTSNLMLFVWK